VSYVDLVELARICINQARAATTPAAAAEFIRLAKEYQRRAAGMNDGEFPDIGEESAPGMTSLSSEEAPHDVAQQQQQPQPDEGEREK
jgi:hypothetical protein